MAVLTHEPCEQVSRRKAPLGWLGERFQTLLAESSAVPQDIFDRFTVDFNKSYGQGGYGQTFPAFDNKTKRNVAVKTIDTRRMKPSAIQRECDFMERVDHPNVIKMLGHGPGRKGTSNQNHHFIFMELANGGELFDQVIDRGGKAMPEDVTKGFMRMLLAGVLHCHDRGIAHRDLKLENVLLTKEGVVKVIDFGLSHQYKACPDGGYDRSVPLTDTCGSKSYAAPEVLAGQGYDGFAADVWSLGVSLFAMLSGFFPLDEATKKDWRYPKLADAQRRGRSTTAVVYGWYKRPFSHLSKSVVDLLDAMLAIDPAQRATMEQVMRHPWIAPSREELRAMGGAEELELEADDQGTYDASELVDEVEGPAWRSAMVVGPAVEVSEMMAADEEEEFSPVYRSLGLADAVDVPLPGLSRQAAFSRVHLHETR